MTTLELQSWWRDAAEHRGLKLEMPYEVSLRQGSVTVPVLLRGYGPANGMLLVANEDSIARCDDELIELGYGYSCLLCLEVPFSPERDLEYLDEMLADWGPSAQ